MPGVLFDADIEDFCRPLEAEGDILRGYSGIPGKATDCSYIVKADLNPLPA
jgi:hypothetical protein